MPRERRIRVENAELYCRELGEGPPILVLHGGPDFDHTYLLPDLDRLAGSYRLIYYDQRGRGRSTAGVVAEDVTMASEVRDLEAVRAHYDLGQAAILGHSFGAVLALEYVLRHPARATHLILVNPAPASAEDFQLFRAARARGSPADLERLAAMRATPAYQAGDPEAVAAYYRVHFAGTLSRPEQLDRLIEVLGAGCTRAGVVLARAIEARLMQETWLKHGYDLLPALRAVRVATLALRGDADFIPAAITHHIAEAIPGARYLSLEDCGHFAYLERPDAFRGAVDLLFRGHPGPLRPASR